MCAGSKNTNLRLEFIPRLAGDLLLVIKDVISPLSVP